MVEDEDEYIVLSVNLEEMDALGLPDRTFIDVNHYPEAMEFLVKNGLATDSEYKRRSGFVEYPMAMCRFFISITRKFSKKRTSSYSEKNVFEKGLFHE